MEGHGGIVQAVAVDETQEIVGRIEDVIVRKSDVRSGGLGQLAQFLVAALLVLGTAGDDLAAELLLQVLDAVHRLLVLLLRVVVQRNKYRCHLRLNADRLQRLEQVAAAIERSHVNIDALVVVLIVRHHRMPLALFGVHLAVGRNDGQQRTLYMAHPQSFLLKTERDLPTDTTRPMRIGVRCDRCQQPMQGLEEVAAANRATIEVVG